MNKHVMFPHGNHNGNHDIEGDSIANLAKFTLKLNMEKYKLIIKKHWPEFENKDFKDVCRVFGVDPPDHAAIAHVLERVRKRLAEETFIKDL